MQLLYSRASPGPEFVSLSLLLKGEINTDESSSSIQMRDPLLLPSPVSTISQAAGVESVQELHRYLVSMHRAVAAMRTNNNNNNNSDKLANALLMEDEKFLVDAQVFRPTKGHGIALHYKLIRDQAAISPLVQLILRSSTSTTTTDGKTNNNNTKGLEREVSGVILCVGMAGLPSAFAMSSLHYSLAQRMRDCIDILARAGTEDGASCATVLSSILLTDDEVRLTNAMAIAQDYHLFTEDTKSGKKKNIEMAVDPEFENPLSMNSSDQARIMVERLAVLSVAQNDTIFRKFEGKTNEKNSKTSRRRKSGRDADLDGFDFRGESKSSRETATPSAATTATSSVSDASSVKSGASKLQLKQPKKDTARVLNSKSRQASVPALMASNKDTGGSRLRRQSIDTPARSRADHRRKSSETTQSTWSVDNGNGSNSAGKNKNFDPFSAHSGDTASTTSETTASSRKLGGNFFDNPDMSMDAGFGGDAFGPDMGTGGSTRATGHSTSGAARVQVNVALNEDLTCFYKLSKMSSCSVEGVVQVQVKTNAEQAVPFYLSIRDPSSHIMSLQENKKFAEDMAGTINQEPPSRRPDYKFTVSVPKGDNYFPVMRYKCGSELRPVPIVSTPGRAMLACLLDTCSFH